jgi:hypothetical protein
MLLTSWTNSDDGSKEEIKKGSSPLLALDMARSNRLDSPHGSSTAHRIPGSVLPCDEPRLIPQGYLSGG